MQNKIDYDNDPLVMKCKEWAVNAHRATNHYYDHRPYEYHLERTYFYAKKYAYILENEALTNPTLNPVEPVASSWTHDVIDDARKKYNDVVVYCGMPVADITYALSNEKGKYRKDRANDKYFAEMREVAYACYSKCCDRLANISEGVATRNTGHIKMYSKEQLYFESQMHSPIYEPMLSEMRCLLYLQPLKDSRSK